MQKRIFPNCRLLPILLLVNSLTMATLFKSVRIFDGTSADLSAPSSVLVQGNKINGGHCRARRRHCCQWITGKILMPGLSDEHYHINMATLDLNRALDPSVDIAEVKKLICSDLYDVLFQLAGILPSRWPKI